VVYILQIAIDIELYCLLIFNLTGNMESGKISILVKHICSKGYKQSELVQFIDLVQKISISYLKYQELLGKNIRPKNTEGLNDLQDVAIDCIAGLFMRNDDEEFVQLTKYFNPIIHSPKKNDNKFFMMMLRRLVVKKTKQELSRIFRERDPEGAKIIRNIRVAIRNSDQFQSFRDMGREFVYQHNAKGDDQKLRRNLLEIPQRVLFPHFLEQYSPNDSVSVMMKKMLSIVTNNPQYQNFLAIDVIAGIIRDVTYQQFKEEVSNDVDIRSPFEDLQIKEVDKVNQNIIDYIHHKIQNQYLKKNKINQQKADIYFKAINDFVQDLTHAKQCESNFRYLKRYIPELTQQMYRDEERSIFEYLVKVTKKSLRKKLKELL